MLSKMVLIATARTSLENKQILDKKDIVIVKKDLKTLNYKIDSVEDKLVDLVKGAVENVECKISQSIQDNERDRRNLWDLFEDNEAKMNEVVKNLNIQKKKVENQEKSYRCEECGDILRKKKDLKLHVKENHPKYIKCDYCDDNFKESWQYETQL